MRLRIYVLLCAVAFASAGAQEAGAVDTAPGTGMNAYDIFGINPEATDSTVIQATATEAPPVAVTNEPAPVATEIPIDDDAEAALMAEIMRLLAERDTLYQTINDLKAENMALTAQTADAEYYKQRSAELETEITRLEGALAETESALAVADSRLVDIEAELADEGSRLADAEAKLAAAGGDQQAVDALLAAKDATIAAKDAAIAERDEALSAKDARLAIAESALLEAKAALVAAQVAEQAAREESAKASASGQAIAATVESTSEAVAAAEKKIAALTAERDAALAIRDAAIATRDAAETARKAAEAGREEALAALAAAKASGAVVTTVAPASIAAVQAGYLSGWKLDTARFSKSLRAGLDGSAARMGAWKIAGTTATQTDASQYFSRLELPLAQGKATTLYRFKARSTGKGWIGLGLHLYVEDVKKPRGYGEGKSLLVWFTRDRKARGDDATYLQLYRSDNDVVMERMFDAELQDGMETWRLVEIVYDPTAEYIAVSVDGVLRAVYKTFFGRDSGATVSLRTLGGGGSFSDFSAWTE